MRGVRQDGDFSHSLTDLMSGVAVMFLVIAAIFMVQAAQARMKAIRLAEENRRAAEKNREDANKYKEIDKRDQEGIQEIEDLRTSLAGNESIELLYDRKKDPRLLTIVFSRDSLQFDSGKCEFGSKKREQLRDTLKTIFPQICVTVGAGLQKSITLEGHTDNFAPLGADCKGVESAIVCSRKGESERCRKQAFESNVQLSAARAQFVFFEARSALQDDEAVAECLDRDFMVAGRGPMDPLDGEAWDKPRTRVESDRNRRVVIKVRVTAASIVGDAP